MRSREGGFKVVDLSSQGVSRSLIAMLGALAMAVSLPASAKTGFEKCASFFAEATAPRVIANTTPKAQRALCFSEFAVLYSGQSKTPLWVAQKLDAVALKKAQAIERTDQFYEEARLPAAERAWLSDYRGSGFDRGHLAPAADLATEEGMAQSFSLANIAPQAAHHNRKAWSKIERDTRRYVMRAQGAVYVITGVHFEQDALQTIGKRDVWVPAAFYKLVVDPKAGKAWAHWLENSDTARPGKPISYEELVRRTGIRYLS